MWGPSMTHVPVGGSALHFLPTISYFRSKILGEGRPLLTRCVSGKWLSSLGGWAWVNFVLASGIYVTSNGDPIYTPMVSTAVEGLRQRSSECRYKVKQFVETGKEQRLEAFKSVNFQAVRVRAGDVWIHVGKILQWEFFRYCQSELAPKQVYCILYQSDPWDVLTSPGVCEIWEYTYGNIPSAPVVRNLPAGFLPLWKPEQNDREAMRRISDFNVGKIEWVFMGHLVRGNRKKLGDLLSVFFFFMFLQSNLTGKSMGLFFSWDKIICFPFRRKCWQHLKRMPELRHVTFTNHISGFRDSDWKKLAKPPGYGGFHSHGGPQ